MMEKMNNNRYCNLYDVEYLLSKDGANYKFFNSCA
ncbi:OspC3 [Shigella sonnei]|uniref:OspC3 n=1 Tax=Shigella sonnei TaxID=624 RepID=A0A8B4LKD9_SHISO|nr:OspC3 [Shigella sonnei]